MSGNQPPQSPRRVRCFTRALKNARYLQQHDPATFDKDKNAEGFGTGVPVEILHRLHLLPTDAPELKSHPAVADFLRKRGVPKPQRWQK